MLTGTVVIPKAGSSPTAPESDIVGVDIGEEDLVFATIPSTIPVVPGSRVTLTKHVNYLDKPRYEVLTIERP